MITYKKFVPQLEIKSLNRRLWCPVCKTRESERRPFPIYNKVCLKHSISSSSERMLELHFSCGSICIYSYGDKTLYLDERCDDFLGELCPICLNCEIDKENTNETLTIWKCGCISKDLGENDSPQLYDILPGSCKGEPFWKAWFNSKSKVVKS